MLPNLGSDREYLDVLEDLRTHASLLDSAAHSICNSTEPVGQRKRNTQDMPELVDSLPTTERTPETALLSPLQVEILSLRKGLIDLLASEPMPERDGAFDSEARSLTANHKRDERLISKYEGDLKIKTIALFRQLKLTGRPGGGMVPLAVNAKLAPHFEVLIKALWTAAEAKE